MIIKSSHVQVKVGESLAPTRRLQRLSRGHFRSTASVCLSRVLVGSAVSRIAVSYFFRTSVISLRSDAGPGPGPGRPDSSR